MFTYDDHQLLQAMDANGLAPNVGGGYDPNAEFDRYSDRSPIFDLPAVVYPPNARPIDLLSLTPGMDTSQPSVTSHANPDELIGTGVLPSPPQASAGISPYHDPSGLWAQFDNSDLGVGQSPDSASYSQGGQIIGMGSQPNLQGSPPGMQDQDDADENAYAARPNTKSLMAPNVASTQTPAGASRPTQGDPLQPPVGWWKIIHQGLENDPFTTPETILQELRQIDTYRTDKGLRFTDTPEGQTYHKILSDRLFAMQHGVPTPGTPNQTQAVRTGSTTPTTNAAPGQQSSAPINTPASPPPGNAWDNGSGQGIDPGSPQNAVYYGIRGGLFRLTADHGTGVRTVATGNTSQGNSHAPAWSHNMGDIVRRAKAGILGEPSQIPDGPPQVIDEPRPGASYVYILTWPGGNGLGSHAAIGVTWPGSKTGQKVYDFGPAGVEEGPSYYLKGGTKPGEVLPGELDIKKPIVPSHLDDKTGDNDQPDSIVRVPVTGAQAKALRSWLIPTEADDSNNWNGSYGRYNGLSNQCSSYVADALAASGITDAFHTIDSPYNGPVITPIALKQWALDAAKQHGLGGGGGTKVFPNP